MCFGQFGKTNFEALTRGTSENMRGEFSKKRHGLTRNLRWGGVIGNRETHVRFSLLRFFGVDNTGCEDAPCGTSSMVVLRVCRLQTDRSRMACRQEYHEVFISEV